jgi:Tfp pilus assembly protein PilO
MSEPRHWRRMTRRVFAEHRAVMISLAAVLVVNVLVYAFFVYPLSQRVSTVAERTQAAEGELAAARVDHAKAAGTLTGKARATEELQTFYERVLPASQAGAVKLAYPRLNDIAREADLEPGGSNTLVEVDRDRELTRFKIRMELAGSYQGIRRFIHQLEQASEFVVIDEVRLQEETGEDGLLGVRLDLSTYYRGTPK